MVKKNAFQWDACRTHQWSSLWRGSVQEVFLVGSVRLGVSACGVCAEGICPGGVFLGDVCQIPARGQIGTCENITLP